MTLPFSQACENNRAAIAEVLVPAFADCSRVLELGAGTGQHSVYLAPKMPWLTWQATDLPERLSDISLWHQAHPSANLAPPQAVDVAQPEWSLMPADGVFSANTCHIMPWAVVELMFAHLPRYLSEQATLCLYGPFNDDGRFTAESNAQFDLWLKQRDPSMGIRDWQAVDRLAQQAGLSMQARHPMPANNQILCWQRG
ncbi:DUF938 domain-containing protein [Ferrimonas marina]|uniref:Methylase n=1 Tax=Ferrimonas marina TaxID=299255 RepID=A0A1M5R954_9GAMM|nr:DUF938 domain-containing protein [Ferrimonas marina]SHH22897.1 Protein of unknown function [Ferrimonas marina]